MSEQNLIKELQDFEEEIASIYKQGLIRAPIHLRDGNETQLIKIFESVKPEDYVFGTWASHLHALLKGIPRELVKQKILDGASITLHFPEYNFYTSAIVGGIAPIAVGTAFSLDQTFRMARSIYNLENISIPRVWCFTGDMALHTGVVYDSILFAIKNDLPITFVVEDNNKSVCTITDKVSIDTFDLFKRFESMSEYENNTRCKFLYYSFTSKYPHSGCGTFVSF